MCGLIAGVILLNGAPQEKRDNPPVIISDIKGKKAGLIVDALVKIDQIYVKPLGTLLDKI
ncbi:MAG: chemotaxis protein CheW [Thermodesulfobacteriota bacterium]|nr:MAG: chemotaxis protein CheW [Thermodesulfobacteriota bacterium]